jgi:hypothetical protein
MPLTRSFRWINGRPIEEKTFDFWGKLNVRVPLKKVDVLFFKIAGVH